MNGFPPGFPGGVPPGGFPPGFAPGASPMNAPQGTPTAPQQQAGGLPSPNGQPNVQAHYCFSGSLWCSGCNPCDACASKIREFVLVPALLEEQMVLGQNLAVVYQTGQPVDLQLLAETFFRMAAQAWKQLHVTMQNMPAQQRPFRVMNVTKVLEAAEIGRQVLIERERAAAAAAAAPVATPANIPPQNMAQPVQPAAAPPVVPAQVIVPPIAPSKPVDFDRAMRAGGDQQPIITVQAEEPAPAASNTSRPIGTEDFKHAAGVNGESSKAPS